jgi:hypothetical protein
MTIHELFTAECGDEFPNEPAVPLLQIPPKKKE